jgi:hypothetical protein
MNVNRIIIGFIACVTNLCLSSWSFVSSAAAATIVVTTNQDVVDPPFNAPGICGAGTVADLPGADGKVSLREAVVAANNTPGSKTITFASSLKDKTIVLTGPLYLCGGHTTLNGDVNGDETPDVTIDGTAVAFPRHRPSLQPQHRQESPGAGSRSRFHKRDRDRYHAGGGDDRDGQHHCPQYRH